MSRSKSLIAILLAPVYGGVFFLNGANLLEDIENCCSFVRIMKSYRRYLVPFVTPTIEIDCGNSILDFEDFSDSPGGK